MQREKPASWGKSQTSERLFEIVDKSFQALGPEARKNVPRSHNADQKEDKNRNHGNTSGNLLFFKTSITSLLSYFCNVYKISLSFEKF